ncbi:MurR/RpiR family transcriptional regulator [Oceanobacillus sp. FSL K6-2867]|uniref:MurR/RpiR family transcriptional regulator n=1 Tax=Oceanobacillus sp. FSL K6-2867 TaxID=2954748 RepID=UPI0030DAEC59
MDNPNILDTILSKKDFLPKKQRILCEYIIENYKSVGVLTITELAEKVGIGTTTILRVVKALGYDSFQEFKKEFHHFTINSGNSTWWHLQRSFIDNESDSEIPAMATAWNEINYLLNETMNDNLIENMEKAVQLILRMDTINVLGLRTSKVAAIYFENLLAEFYPKTRQLSYDHEFIFDRILQFKKGDLLILIAQSPFTTLSLKVAEYCYQQGHPFILITDHYSCPVASYAEIVFHTQASDKQYSIVPTMALLETLVIEIGKRTSSHSIDHLQKLGDLLKEKNITT